jgi:hypothetical protein
MINCLKTGKIFGKEFEFNIPEFPFYDCLDIKLISKYETSSGGSLAKY